MGMKFIAVAQGGREREEEKKNFSLYLIINSILCFTSPTTRSSSAAIEKNGDVYTHQVKR